MRCTMDAMPPGATTQLRIPRWVQLVGLPLLLLLAWVVAGAVRHVVFLFLVAALVALLLDPLVKGLNRLRIPRGISVAIVYLSFAAALIVAIIALATVVVDQTKTASNRIDDYFTVVHGQPGTTHADRDVNRLQHWLDTHGLSSVKVQKRGHDLVSRIRKHDVGRYTHRVVRFLEGAAISVGKLLFALILILVVSIYMLLDMPRLARVLERRFPSNPGTKPLLNRMEEASPGAKHNFLFGFLEKARPAFERAEGVVLAECARCGQVTTGTVCAFCKLADQVKRAATGGATAPDR